MMRTHCLARGILGVLIVLFVATFLRQQIPAITVPDVDAREINRQCEPDNARARELYAANLRVAFDDSPELVQAGGASQTVSNLLRP
jgi:hypothetical protein